MGDQGNEMVRATSKRRKRRGGVARSVVVQAPWGGGLQENRRGK